MGRYAALCAAAAASCLVAKVLLLIVGRIAWIMDGQPDCTVVYAIDRHLLG
jgi:hypothetical protein